MAILVDQNTKVLIQGITGRAGTQVCEMLQKYNTKVVAGVRPGKGGEEVLGVPVYNTVAQAVENHPEINTSLIYVPPGFVLDAAIEAIEARIALIHIFTEKIPVLDSAKIFAASKTASVKILGPASIGAISPNLAKIGSIGGFENRGFKKGSVSVISKSGGMCSEIANLLTNSGFGQSTVVGIGGDVIIGTNFVDCLELFERDGETKGVVLFGEVGGTYEEEVAKLVKNSQIKKPIVAFIAGEFTQKLPSDVQFGHAGAIIEGKRGLPSEKRRILRESGVYVADDFDEIPTILKKII